MVGPTTQKAEAIAPVVAFGIGVAVTAIASLLYDYYNGGINDNQAVSSGNPVATYRQLTAEHYINALELAKSTALNDAELAGLTTNYYARLGEMAALMLYQSQKENEIEFVYDRDFIFNECGVYETLLAQWNMSKVGLQAVIESLVDYQNRFVGDYTTMSLSTIKWNGVGTSDQLSGNAASNLKVKLASQLSLTAGHKHILDANSSLYVWNVGTSGTWTAITLSYENGTVAGTWSGDVGASTRTLKTIPLKTIVADAPEEPTIYTIGITGDYPTNRRIASDGAFRTFTGTNDGTQTPGIITYKDGWENLGMLKFYPVTEGTNINVNGDGTTSIDVSGSINAVASAYAEIITLGTVANNYAQTYFNYLVNNGDDGIPYLPPSALFIDPAQMATMSIGEIYALYVAYMLSLQQGFLDGYTVTAGDMKISLDSLKLVCRGAIYNDTGAQIADNQTIFTPFVSLMDWTISLGNNTFNQPGFCMGWARSSNLTSLYTDPEQVFFTPETMRYIKTGLNYTVCIEEMYFDGEPIEEYTLTVTDLTVYFPEFNAPSEGWDFFSDAEWLLSRWYYFAIVAGIICLVAAISFRNTAIIIVGLILLAAGAIGYFLAGDYSILDALNLSMECMESVNLKAWLQNIR